MKVRRGDPLAPARASARDRPGGPAEDLQRRRTTGTRPSPRRARSPARRASVSAPSAPAKTSTTALAPSPARTTGAGEDGRHPARTSGRRGAAGRGQTPSGTSTKTGSGVNASLSRTSASPPVQHRTEHGDRRQHVVGAADRRARRTPCAVGWSMPGRPSETSTLPAVEPSPSPSAARMPPPADRRCRVPARVGRAGRELLEVEVVDRRVPPDLLALGRERGRREGLVAGARRSRSQSGPGRTADASAVKVGRVGPLSGGEGAHALYWPPPAPSPGD